jgi:hypothetical protein
MKVKGCFEIMDRRFEAAHTFAGIRLPDAGFLIPATSLDPKKAPGVHRKRWQIECLFGDARTRGFNMKDTGLAKSAKLSVPPAPAASEMAWSLVCASVGKGKRNIPRPSRAYCRKSSFRTGFDTPGFWMTAQPDQATQSWEQCRTGTGKPVGDRRIVWYEDSGF